MSVCKYFLENRCRYGENCRFEHPRGGGAQRNLFGGGGGGNSNWSRGNSGQKVTFHDSFGTSSNQGGNNQFKWVANQNQSQGGQSAAQPSSALELVNALPKEMEIWEKTKMWPFSCLSVEKDSPSLPDFSDMSVEELRLEYYEAQKTGSIAAYIQRFQNLVTEYQDKRMHLKRMDNNLKQKLIMFIDQARQNKSNQGSSSTTSSVFGQSSAGSTNQTAGLFGQSSGGGLFSKPSGGGVFGSPAASTSQASPFGKPQACSNPFSSSQTSGSIFGGHSNQSQPSSSIFGGQSSQSQSSGSLFGGNQQPSSIFGSPSSSSQGGLFGKPAAAGSSTSAFGSAASPAPGLFGGGQQQASAPNIFGTMSTNPSPSPAPGLFGGPASNLSTQPQAQSVGLFGKPAGSPAQPGGGLLPTPQGQGLLPTPQSQPMSGGLFGKSTPSAPGFPTPQPGLFGKPLAPNSGSATATGAGLFGKGLFGSGSSPAPAPGLFGGGGGVSAGAGLFGKGPSVGGSSGAGLFGKGPSQVNSPFTGVQASPDPNADLNKGRYSLMEELTAQEIEAFKAPSFTLGKLPIKPPPKELIIM